MRPGFKVLDYSALAEITCPKCKNKFKVDIQGTQRSESFNVTCPKCNTVFVHKKTKEDEKALKECEERTKNDPNAQV